MSGLTSLPNVIPSACNVSRHTGGSALIPSSSHTGRTVGEHGNSERTILITVKEIAINHGGLSGRHGGNRHCVGFVSDSHEDAAMGFGTKEEKLINPT